MEAAKVPLPADARHGRVAAELARETDSPSLFGAHIYSIYLFIYMYISYICISRPACLRVAGGPARECLA